MCMPWLSAEKVLSLFDSGRPLQQTRIISAPTPGGVMGTWRNGSASAS